MLIRVKLYASFRLRLFNEAERECPSGVSVAEAALLLGIAPEEIGIMLVNGKHAKLSDPLQEGDLLSLMPQIGGG